jgi:hypothetical protein
MKQTTWEYTQLTSPQAVFSDHLYKLGSKGWELVSVIYTGSEAVAYLKRNIAVTDEKQISSALDAIAGTLKAILKELQELHQYIYEKV